jgi:hypothetical protein
MLQKAIIGEVDPHIKEQIDWWHNYLAQQFSDYHDKPEYDKDLDAVMKAGYQIINDLAKKIRV